MNFTLEERTSYEDHLKWMMIEANTLEKRYRDGIEEGRVEGIGIGREEGEKIGEERGIERGLKEGKTKIAKNLISMNLDAEVIVKATGLTKDEIENIYNTLIH